MVLWVVGAVINVFGSILINAGTNMMKLGHNKRATLDEEEETPTPPVRHIRAWQLGVGLFIIGNLANFGSFAFAAQSILAALGSVQFIANVVFGRLILREPVTRQVLIATALIVAGCVVIVSFGNHSSETFSSKQLQAFYKSEGYQEYLCFGAVIFASSYSLYRYGNTLRKKRGEAMEATSKLWLRLLPTCYSVFAALLGAQSVLFSKAISLLLRTTIQGSGQLSSWFFWVNFILFIGAAAFWVTRLNLALRLFPAVVIVPTMQIAWTLVSITSGMVFYQEYRGLSAIKAAMFAVGVVLVFCGVWILTTAPSSSSGAQMADEPWSGLEDEQNDGYPATELVTSGVAGAITQNGGMWHQQDPSKERSSDNMPSISERIPLSPQAAEPSFSGSDSKRPTAKGRYHWRDASILKALTWDFRRELQETGRQIENVAEHMAPPYDQPSTPSPHHVSSHWHVPKARSHDMEIANMSAAITSPKSNRKESSAGEEGSNPFAGAFGRPSASNASDVSEPTHRIFDSGFVMSDDDPGSPTWADSNSRRVSDYEGVFNRDEGPRSAAKAFLQALSPRHRGPMP